MVTNYYLQINVTIKGLRANDTARLRDKIASYIPRDPMKDAVLPPIHPSKARS